MTTDNGPGFTICPAPPVDAQPGDVIYREGQLVEVGGVTQTVAVDAVVMPDGQLHVWFLVAQLPASPENLIDLTPSSPVLLPNRYSAMFEELASGGHLG